MSDTLLIYEPESPPDLDLYSRAVQAVAPHLQVLTAATEEQAMAVAAQATLLAAKAHHVRPNMIQRMPRLRWIQALTTGTDALARCNLDPAVVVTSVRGVHGPQMAELALMLMLALYRDLPRMTVNQRQQHWQRWGQRLLLGRTALVVGVGSISEALATRAAPFGLRMWGISQRTSAPGFERLYPREQMLQAVSAADFLVLLIPYTPESHHLVDARVLAAMKPDAYLLNLARGPVVDEAALIAALQERRIAGAGLDVFEQEPLPASSPLWSMEQVIITPHIGGMSDIYAQQVAPLLVHNVQALLGGRLDQLMNRVS